MSQKHDVPRRYSCVQVSLKIKCLRTKPLFYNYLALTQKKYLQHKEQKISTGHHFKIISKLILSKDTIKKVEKITHTMAENTCKLYICKRSNIYNI